MEAHISSQMASGISPMIFCLDVPLTGLTVTYFISFELSVATWRIIGSIISGIVSPTFVSALLFLIHSRTCSMNPFTSSLAIMASLSCMFIPKNTPCSILLVSIFPSPFSLFSFFSGLGCFSSSVRISSSIPAISVSRSFFSFS